MGNRITRVVLFVLSFVLCCFFLLLGCTKKEDSRTAKPEEFAGIWEPSQLELGGKTLDLTKDTFKIELYDDLSGKLVAGNEEQNIQWEIRGFKGEYVDVRVFVTLEKSFPLGGVDADPKSFMFIYSTENDTFSFENSWHSEVNGMDARFNLSGIMKRVQ